MTARSFRSFPVAILRFFVLIFVLTAIFVAVYRFASCDINKPDDDDEEVFFAC